MFQSYVNECVECIKKLAEVNGIILNNGIEFFCGDGSIYTLELFKQLTKMTGIDIAKEKGERLKAKLGSSFSYINADSVQYIRETVGEEYDIVSIDNPLCLYGNDYCEHFGILPYIHKFVKKNGYTIIAFDYVTVPYNEDKDYNCKWLERRKAYYKTSDYNIDTKFAEKFYSELLMKYSLNVVQIKSICRETYNNRPYFYMMLCVVKGMYIQ